MTDNATSRITYARWRVPVEDSGRRPEPKIPGEERKASSRGWRGIVTIGYPYLFCLAKSRICTSASFEVLNFSFVFFRRLTRCEGPKIPPLSGLGVLLSRVQAVLTCFEFPDHLSALPWTFNRPTACASAAASQAQRGEAVRWKRLGGFPGNPFPTFSRFLLLLLLPPWHRTFLHRGQARGAISETLQRVHVPRPLYP